MYHCSKCVLASPFQTMIDLPKEVMELVYRQALIWVAALYVPLIYPIGVIAQVAVFFVKYISFRGYYRAPLKPFSRSKVTRASTSPSPSPRSHPNPDPNPNPTPTPTP